MSSRIHATYTKPVRISPIVKPAGFFKLQNGWYWEATTPEGVVKTGGPFLTQREARDSRKKYAEQLMKRQRSSAKAGK
jgi:hypothetical protein